MKRLVCLGALLALTACTRKLDNAQAEKGMAEHFAKFFPVEKVTCPKGVKLEKGSAFVCTIKFTGGDEFKVDAIINEVKDNQGEYEFKINEPVFDPKGTAAWIAEELTKQSGLEAKVDCGAPRHPTADDRCTATAPDGKTSTVSVKVGADGNPQSWEVK